MNFVAMADAKYFRTVMFSAAQSARFYPERRFVFYDWGFEPDQLRRLAALRGVEIRNWRNRVVAAERILPRRSPLKRFIKTHLLRHPDFRIPLHQWQREMLLDEKCYCLLDAAARLDGAFLFLDADAFLVNDVNDLLATDCDVVVTLRPRAEIEAARRRGARSDINSGVIFFNRDRVRTITFITEWIKEMNVLNLRRHLLSEQTALSELLLRADPDAFREPNRRVQLTFGDQSIRCLIAPTDRYNYNAVERGFDPEHNRILHLKSGRGFSDLLGRVQAALGCDGAEG